MSGMSCREFERPLMDRARNRPMDAAVRTAFAAHLEMCARCSQALDLQMRRSASMEVLAERTADVSAPPSVRTATASNARSRNHSPVVFASAPAAPSTARYSVAVTLVVSV